MRSKHWHLFDNVIVRKLDVKDVHSVRAMRGADCWTDHRLVRAKFALVISPKHQKRHSPYQSVLMHLFLKVFQENIAKNPPLDNSNPWLSFRDTVSEVAVNV